MNNYRRKWTCANTAKNRFSNLGFLKKLKIYRSEAVHKQLVESFSQFLANILSTLLYIVFVPPYFREK